MLRTEAGQTCSLFELALPQRLRQLPADLAAIDQLLADDKMLEPLRAHWKQEVETGQIKNASWGRPTISVKVSRREALVGVLGAATGAVATALFRNTSVNPEHTHLAELQAKTDGLEEKVKRLSYNTASGGGVNLKMMPDPASGAPTVPLEEVFSFDRNHAMCRVDTNPQAFKMQTFASGEVLVPANKFFMAMVVTTIDQFLVSTAADQTRHLTMRGGLSCKTEVGLAAVTIGSRTAAEHATYEIEAVDGGIRRGNDGDSFAFTVSFDPNQAPVNHAIFGPKFTFTGKMIDGKITIVDPVHPEADA